MKLDLEKRVETYITYWKESKSARKIKTGLFFTNTYKLANTPVRGYIKMILNKDEHVNEEMLNFLNLVYKYHNA